MQRTELFGVVLLFLLPFGTIGVSLHGIVKRDTHGDGMAWSYESENGPSHWSAGYPTCSGAKQSPVNIEKEDLDLNEDLDDFEFDTHYDDDFIDATMKNNGHTVQISPGVLDSPRSIEEGGLKKEYQFLQLHFHWGSKANQGSEHQIDGEAFDLEMHLVHVNQGYANQTKAMQMGDGLAVLAVLFEESKQDNPALTPIIDSLHKVKREGKETKVSGFDLRSLLPEKTMPYYRYQGSLTTPPCYESVVWTIFEDVLPIGRKQLEQFRSLTEDDPDEPAEQLVDNYRPPQDLNGRVVEVSSKSNSAMFGPSVVALLSALSLFL